MSARKLQAEIERTFKKIQEGISAFDDLQEKLDSSTNPSQKEKIESDLKKEIKRLQRLRDQLKVWVANNDIKDKIKLLENRRLIEKRMEEFKLLEKEMKTKAFSKEGLSAAAKLDPKEKEKMQLTKWLTGIVDELERQVEQLEVESGNLQIAVKKKSRDSQNKDRLKEVEHHIDRHKFHIDKLERILRLIENETLSVTEIENIKDDIKYYVDSNQDPDFTEDFDIYEDLNLSERDFIQDQEITIMNTTPVDANTPAPPLGEDTEANKKPATDPDSDTLKRVSSTEMSSASKEPAKPLSTSKNAYTSTSTDIVSSHNQQTPVVNPKKPTSSKLGMISFPATAPKQAFPLDAKQLATPSGKSETLQYANVLASTKADSYDSVVRNISESSTQGLYKGIDTASHGASASQFQDQTDQTLSFINSLDLNEEANEIRESFSHFKDTCVKANNIQSVQDISTYITTSFNHVADAVDCSDPEHYIPKNSYTIPIYYPHQPLPSLESQAIVAKMDLDTLFYMFYYRMGTYQQYLAAKELKKQNWRFHKKYQTWFQRHEEPKTITDEFESGTYRYFDFEGSWIQRKKADFKFMYSYLEDEE